MEWLFCELCAFYFLAGRGGRKLDDVRDKYQKACRKLHLAHNEYVLLISEASEVETDFRTILLPGLLEHQQSVQEEFIIVWYVFTFLPNNYILLIFYIHYYLVYTRKNVILIFQKNLSIWFWTNLQEEHLTRNISI